MLHADALQVVRSPRSFSLRFLQSHVAVIRPRAMLLVLGRQHKRCSCLPR